MSKFAGAALLLLAAPSNGQDCKQGGFLSYPRIAFAGQFYSTPSTVNNVANNFDYCTFDDTEGVYGNQLQQELGNGGFAFSGVTVKSVTYKDGSTTTDASVDPVIGMSVMDMNQPRYCDLDVLDQFASAIYGLRVKTDFLDGVMPHTGVQGIAQATDEFELRDAGHFSGLYQAPLDLVGTFNIDNINSRALTELAACIDVAKPQVAITFSAMLYNADHAPPVCSNSLGTAPDRILPRGTQNDGDELPSNCSDPCIRDPAGEGTGCLGFHTNPTMGATFGVFAPFTAIMNDTPHHHAARKMWSRGVGPEHFTVPTGPDSMIGIGPASSPFHIAYPESNHKDSFSSLTKSCPFEIAQFGDEYRITASFMTCFAWDHNSGNDIFNPKLSPARPVHPLQSFNTPRYGWKGTSGAQNYNELVAQGPFGAHLAIFKDGKYISVAEIDVYGQKMYDVALVNGYTITREHAEYLEDHPLHLVQLDTSESQVEVGGFRPRFSEASDGISVRLGVDNVQRAQYNPESGAKSAYGDGRYQVGTDFTWPLVVTEFGARKAGYDAGCKHNPHLYPGLDSTDNDTPSDVIDVGNTMTDANGKAQLTLAMSGEPISPFRAARHIDGQTYGIQYDGTSEFLHLLLWQTFHIEGDEPTWYDDIQPILTMYAKLYHVMRPFLDLDNAEVMESMRLSSYRVMTRDWEDPRFMPVTRDLSPMKTDAILRWLLNPIKGTPRAVIKGCEDMSYSTKPYSGVVDLKDCGSDNSAFADGQRRLLLDSSDCTEEEYYSPNQDRCFRRVGANKYCNVVQKCLGGLDCKNYRCADACSESTIMRDGVCVSHTDHNNLGPGSPLMQPEIYESKDGVLEVTLRESIEHMQDYFYDCPQYRVFNGKTIGDTYVVTAGHQFKVHFVNDMGLITDSHDHIMNYASPNNGSNLHLHGLHVSAHQPADDVFHTKVYPGETYDYVYDIPGDHMPGHSWYHPHYHGTATMQTQQMYGNLYIKQIPGPNTPGFQNLPKSLAKMQEYTVATNVPGYDMSYPMLSNNQMYALSGMQKCTKRTALVPERYRLVNSQYKPSLKVYAGVPFLLNTLNSDSREPLEIFINDHTAGCNMWVMSKDGIPLSDAPRAVNTVWVANGGRIAILMLCHGTGEAAFSERHELGDEFLTFNVIDRKYGATTAAAINAMAPLDVVYPDYLNSLLNRNVDVRHDLYYNVSMNHPGGKGQYAAQTTAPNPVDEGVTNFDNAAEEVQCFAPYATINHKLYDGNAPFAHIPHGAVVETSMWGSQPHPHHQHTHPFQLSYIPPYVGGDEGRNQLFQWGGTNTDYGNFFKIGDWHDSLLFNVDAHRSVIKFLWSPLDFIGSEPEIMIFHCHILPHEDMGMMSYYMIDMP